MSLDIGFQYVSILKYIGMIDVKNKHTVYGSLKGFLIKITLQVACDPSKTNSNSVDMLLSR